MEGIKNGNYLEEVKIWCSINTYYKKYSAARSCKKIVSTI